MIMSERIWLNKVIQSRIRGYFPYIISGIINVTMYMIFVYTDLKLGLGFVKDLKVKFGSL